MLSPVPTFCPAPPRFLGTGTTPTVSCIASCCSSGSWTWTCFSEAGSCFLSEHVFCGCSPEHLLHARHSPCPPPPHSLLTQVESCTGNCTPWQARLPVLVVVVFEAESLYVAQAALQLTHLLPPPSWRLLPFLRQATGLWASLPYSKDEQNKSQLSQADHILGMDNKTKGR